MGFKCFLSLPLTVACRRETAQRLPLMKCPWVIVPARPFGLGSLRGAGLPRPLCADSLAGALGYPRTPHLSSGPGGQASKRDLRAGGSPRVLGLWVPASFSVPVCPQPLCTPVSRSGGPQGRAGLLQEGPGGFRPRQHPWVDTRPLGKQLSVTGRLWFPLTPVQASARGGTCAPRCLGHARAFRWMFRAGLTPPPVTRDSDPP